MSGALGISRERFSQLGAAGSEHFDPLGHAHLASLLARAEALGGGAAAILAGRIDKRIADFEASFTSGRAAAEEALRGLAAAGIEAPPSIHALLARGDFAGARREARRVSLAHAAEKKKSTRARPTEIATPEIRFRDAAEEARATLAVARASDNLPEDAGPYNGQVLAARALEAMASLSPGYVRALIAGLDDLAALEAVLAPPEPRKAKKAPKRKQGAASA